MLSNKITFFKEDKVAINEKKHIGYLKIFIHHYENMLNKKTYLPTHLKKGYDSQRNAIH